jgi:hypothetical protein
VQGNYQWRGSLRTLFFLVRGKAAHRTKPAGGRWKVLLDYV